MRTQLFGSFLLSALVGCGGGGGSNTPDAKIFLDAAIDAAPTCTFLCESNICDGMDGSPAPGTNAFPGLRLNYTMPIDFYEVETMGPLAGRTIMTIGGNTGMTAAGMDIILFDVVKPANGGFPLNTAITLDPDPTAMTPAAYALWLGDFIEGVGAKQIYYGNAGAVTLTSASETDGGSVAGMISMTGAREIDGETGMDIAGGCTVTMGGLMFMGTQKEGMAFQPTSAPQKAIDLQPLTATQREYARTQLSRIRALRGH